MQRGKYNEIELDEIIEEANDYESEFEDDFCFGVIVADGAYLYTEADPYSDVICILEKGAEVKIDEYVDRNNFYKISTEYGIVGYVPGESIEI